MVRDREGWNARIRKRIGNLQGRGTVLSVVSVPVLQTTNNSESADSTSNSIALSQAVLRAKTTLQEALREVEYEDNTSSIPDAALLDYIGRIECYSNHKVNGTLLKCNLKPVEWQKICSAAHAAKDVHKMLESSAQTTLVSGSLTGTVKTYSVTKRIEGGEQYLIIAIRASRTLFDWATNFNSEQVDLPELGSGIKCHKGFLAVARKMRSSIEDAVKEQYSILHEPVQVILTGHSSGAAVAQLLYAMMFASSSRSSGGAITEKIDCITFGGPPVSVPPLPELVDKGGGLFLNIVNEGDPIILAQPEYINNLLKAYVSPPSATAGTWEIPAPTYLASGRQILLRDTVEDGSDLEYTEAFCVDHSQMGLVIFGNPMRHSMTLYLNRVVEIRDRQP